VSSVADRAALVLEGQRSTETVPKRCPNVVYLDFACKRRTCPVCGPRRARELARVLMLDAQIAPPSHLMTLTTHDVERGIERFAVGMQKVFNRRDGLRRFWDVEYFAKVEFTTGRGVKSGGARRMHCHCTLKGLDSADVLNVERIARERWEAVTGAFVVEVAQLRTPAAALHYLGLHHAKSSQLPPSTWRGMAERASRGYWSRPIGELRTEARAQLWSESLAWSTGLELADARFLVDGQMAAGELRRSENAAQRIALLELRRPDDYEPADAAPSLDELRLFEAVREVFPW
jgi:hypothetical protein